MTAAPTADLSAVLDDAALASLRKSYSAQVLLKVSRVSTVDPNPDAFGYATWVVDYLYDGVKLKPVDRERTLVALLASQTTSSSLMLAIHLYWGLMEGLTVRELSDTLALSGAYTGLPHYTAGLMTFRKTLEALRDLCADAGAKLDAGAVIGLLKTRFA